jgi:Sulfotransferase domain
MVSVGRKDGSVIDRLPVPDIIIGGAPRSGTTFLCELLAKHPGVFIAKPFIPEPKVCMTPHPDGDAGLLQRYGVLFSDATPHAIRVEKTSYYLENAAARERLVRILPNAKFVFILREPVERAYSNWVRSRLNGIETLPFEDAIEREPDRVSPLPPQQAYARPFDYLSRGRYGSLIEAWISTVGRERLAIYIFEAAIAAPDAFVLDLQRFIGVDPLPWSALATGKINAIERGIEGLDERTAATLREKMRPEVEHLARIADVDVGRWGY